MSYYAGVSFIKAKPDDLETVLQKLKDAIREHIDEIAERDCVFSPYGKNPSKKPEEQHKNFIASFDWAEDIFTYRFFFLGEGEEQVLAVVGVPSPCQDVFDDTIFFQDSTDTDYDYETWDKVALFKRLVAERVARVKAEGYNWTDYRNKSDCYDIIWKMLDDKVFGTGFDVRLFCKKSDFQWLSIFVAKVRERYQTKYGS